jgi:methionyl-tRNA formyltransferase
LQDGVRTTGVSVAFTVLACDAGPVFLQEAVDVPEDEQAPELLARLFRRGAQLLVAGLPRVWSGDAATAAAVQDHAAATHAAKARHNPSWDSLCLERVNWSELNVSEAVLCCLRGGHISLQCLVLHIPAIPAVLHSSAITLLHVL